MHWGLVITVNNELNKKWHEGMLDSPGPVGGWQLTGEAVACTSYWETWRLWSKPVMQRQNTQFHTISSSWNHDICFTGAIVNVQCCYTLLFKENHNNNKTTNMYINTSSKPYAYVPPFVWKMALNGEVIHMSESIFTSPFAAVSGPSCPLFLKESVVWPWI